MAKIPKVVAGYLPSRLVARKGTSCDTCRDYIKDGSECMIVNPPAVSGPTGTCILYILGQPHLAGTPKRLIPQKVAGYIEGPEVPTFCGKCEHYEHPNRGNSTCAKVGDSEADHVEYGGCCNAYQAREK